MSEHVIDTGKLYQQVFNKSEDPQEQAELIDKLLTDNRDCLVALFMKENPELKLANVELVLHHSINAVYITVRKKIEKESNTLEESKLVDKLYQPRVLLVHTYEDTNKVLKYTRTLPDTHRYHMISYSSSYRGLRPEKVIFINVDKAAINMSYNTYVEIGSYFAALDIPIEEVKL